MGISAYSDRKEGSAKVRLTINGYEKYYYKEGNNSDKSYYEVAKKLVSPLGSVNLINHCKYNKVIV